MDNSIIKKIPNILSCTRIVLALVLIFIEPLSVPFFWVYSLAAFTDMIDGPIARKFNATSTLGSKLDSIGDLLLFTVMMVKMLPLLKLYLPKYCWTMISFSLLARIIMYLVVFFKEKSLMSSHNYLNKATGFSIFFVPYFIGTKYFVPYAIAVCIVAIFAALWDAVILIRKYTKRS